MTVAQILTAVYDETLNSTSPSPAVTTRLTRYINDGYRLILSEPALARLYDSDVPYTFASVASQTRYAFPSYLTTIKKIRETTNDITLNAMSLDQYRRIEPDPATVTGTPTHYVPMGVVGVATQPADASAIFVKSSSAADTTQTVTVRGIRSGSNVLFANAALLTGTTAVQIGAAPDLIEITDWSLSATAVGTVTLSEDSGVGATLSTIIAGSLKSAYFAIALWPTPAAAITYSVDYRRTIFDLTATDTPILPDDYHQMLVDYATMREFELKGDTERVLIAKQRFEKRLTRLKYQTQWVADELPVLNSRRRVGHSRLGGQYPADTWTRF